MDNILDDITKRASVVVSESDRIGDDIEKEISEEISSIEDTLTANESLIHKSNNESLLNNDLGSKTYSDPNLILSDLETLKKKMKMKFIGVE